MAVATETPLPPLPLTAQPRTLTQKPEESWNEQAEHRLMSGLALLAHGCRCTYSICILLTLHLLQISATRWCCMAGR